MAAAALGVFASLLGISGSLTGMIQKGLYSSFESAKNGQTTVRVHVGMSTNQTDNPDFGGDRPGVALFNDFGQYIGKANGNARKKWRLGPGTFVDIIVPHNDVVGNVRPDWISLTNGGGIDGICIAAVATTFPDTHRAVIYADMFVDCEPYLPDPVAFSYSRARVGDDDIVPFCIWLDGDDTTGYRGGKRSPQGISWNIQSFQVHEARMKAYNDNPRLHCTAPRLKTWNSMRTEWPIDVYDPPLEFTTNYTDVDPNRILHPAAGQVKPSMPAVDPDEPIHWQNGTWTFPPRAQRAFFADDHVIISVHEQHSAKFLCGNPYSRSPSWVCLPEKKFCDMRSRQIWDLCDAENGISAPCYDLEVDTMRYLDATSTSQNTTAVQPDMVFRQVERWGWE